MIFFFCSSFERFFFLQFCKREIEESQEDAKYFIRWMPCVQTSFISHIFFVFFFSHSENWFHFFRSFRWEIKFISVDHFSHRRNSRICVWIFMLFRASNAFKSFLSTSHVSFCSSPELSWFYFLRHLRFIRALWSSARKSAFSHKPKNVCVASCRNCFSFLFRKILLQKVKTTTKRLAASVSIAFQQKWTIFLLFIFVCVQPGKSRKKET